MRFFKREEMENLKIGFDFAPILNEYFKQQRE